MTRLWIALGATAAALLIGGCAYDAGFYNTSQDRLENVHLAEYPQPTADVLLPGTQKKTRRIKGKIPREATVVWRTPDGVQHHQHLGVASNVPAFFRGTVWYTFLPDGRVTVEPEDEREAFGP